MNLLKISFLWTSNLENNLIFKLIKILSKKKIKITSVNECDFLIFGPYDQYSIKRKILNTLRQKVNNIEKIFPNLDVYLINRKIKPLRLFYSQEYYGFPSTTKYDFAITPHLGISKKNHFRFASWKDSIDWSHEGIHRELITDVKRFGEYYNINDLISPQGNSFLKKERKICLITSHLNEPRKSIYEELSKNFIIDGYGPYFDKNITNHNASKFTKKEILKNYSFNLCPENALYPGYYTEKVPDAFLGKCLPLAWADNYINCDFNEKSFINLYNYTKENYSEINYLLKDDIFLKKFSDQPLLINTPNLNLEISFLKKILDSF